jgi:hypothetical protein
MDSASAACGLGQLGAASQPEEFMKAASPPITASAGMNRNTAAQDQQSLACINDAAHIARIVSTRTRTKERSAPSERRHSANFDGPGPNAGTSNVLNVNTCEAKVESTRALNG